MPQLLNRVRSLWQHPGMTKAYCRWVLHRGLLRRNPITTSEDGVRTGDWDSFTEFWRRLVGIEPDDRAAMLYALRQAPAGASLAVDVGAHIGAFSIAMAKLGYSRIYSYEPTPRTQAKLFSNLKLNQDVAGRITVKTNALGAEPGEIEFVLHANQPGLNRMATAQDVTSTVEKIKVPLKTLDAEAAENGWDVVHFLKVDVEGFEIQVLKGAATLLREKRIKFVYLEVIEAALNNAGESVLSLFAFMESLDYTPQVLTGDRLVPFTAAEAPGKISATNNVLWSA